MRRVVESRNFISFVLSAAIGLYLFRAWPFPSTNNVLHMVLLEKPQLFYATKYAFAAMLFTTPFIAFSILLSSAYIFAVREDVESRFVPLPTYPNPTARRELFLILGELHHPRRAEPSDNPRWLMIPERGLYTGIAVFGAIGSGKTSGCIYPFAEQLLAFQSQDAKHRLAGLALEVKGDFCHKLRSILKRHGREEDYVEISLDSEYRYNPLHNDLEAYALAYGIASLLNNLFGRGKEPFWQQAYTNLVKFIILLHKVLYD